MTTKLNNMNSREIFIDMKNVPKPLRRGIEILSPMLNLSFEHNRDAAELCFMAGAPGIDICADGNTVKVIYGDKSDAFRALGLVHARRNDLNKLKICEKRRLDKIFVMLDVSRNAVLNHKSTVQWLSFMALAGINGFMFYTEDTFEVPGENLFGYLRGRLSCKEIKCFDDIADNLGIEMIPCIQTLAHLERVLHYAAYEPIRDTASVMLCDSPKTLEFVEKIMAAALAPYRSKRIHLGMDEARDLGRGAFLIKNGYHRPSEIISRHLKNVMKIVRRMQLRPMIWSDMFFQAIDTVAGYHSKTITAEQLRSTYHNKVDPELDLVYWNYGQVDKDDYSRMFTLHEAINGRKPLMAPGIHTWNRFWAASARTLETITPCLESCLENNINETIITIWGDDGAENDYFSALPYLQYAADGLYSGKFDMAQTRENLRGSLGLDFDDWNYAGTLDLFGNRSPFITKTFMWEDPMIGLVQPQLDGVELNSHFRNFADKLHLLLAKGANERLGHVWRITDILADKVDLPTLLREAYLAGNRKQLEIILNRTVPVLIEKVRAQRNAHRQLWLNNYKPYGWDVLERRYGGLIACFENLQYRLSSYLNGNCEKLEELEDERHKINERPVEDFPLIPRQYVESVGYL